MSAAFWAADSIATQLNANANAARARSTLAQQQGYHCGAVAVCNAALSELGKIDPQNPILISLVQNKISELGEREFWRHGWDHACQFQADPGEVYIALLAVFETERADQIAKTLSIQIQERARGWFFKRRAVWQWAAREFNTHEGAAAAKQAELARLAAASLGDQLD